MSGLKVNFLKSKLVGINIPQNWIIEAAEVIKCGMSSLRNSYLGLPIGANAKQMETWDAVINMAHGVACAIGLEYQQSYTTNGGNTCYSLKIYSEVEKR
ncbi:hypothetical protein KIW84_011012 [Lathyrus oleraceus]|uniref:Uncharacterized protein n=1 Tax=Pisum sativum TaxID=3888 RepID=A0A9D5BEK5_PEA|nr:hypothetical protein KIW84_011012 [Pisum sativum]